MLLVKHLPDHNELYDLMLETPEFLEELDGIGVHMTQDCVAPDLLFVGHKRFQQECDALMNQPVPIVLHGSYDYGCVPYPYRGVLHEDKIVRLIQGSNFVSLEEHNAPLNDGYRHGALISSTDSYLPMPLSQEAVNKIRIWAGFAVTAAINANFRIPKVQDSLRPIRLHAVMNLAYSSDLLTKHRRDAVAAVRNYTHRSFSSMVFGCSAGDIRAMDNGTYSKTMQMCVATLSPWGWGEYCIRDFEALLAGSVLIKPDTSFSRTWPTLTANEHYVACAPDFTDLLECVERARDLARNTSWRQALQHRVNQARNVTLLARRFKECLTC